MGATLGGARKHDESMLKHAKVDSEGAWITPTKGEGRGMSVGGVGI